MRAKITVDKVITNDNKVKTFTGGEDQWVELNNARFYPSGAATPKLIIQHYIRGGAGFNTYFCQIPFSTAITRLDGALGLTKAWDLSGAV